MNFRMEQARRFAVPLWFLLLAAVVLGPLLGDGYLLLLDAPAGPDAPWQTFFPPPSQGLVTSAALAVNILRMVGEINPEVPNKILIALTIVAGGVGMFRLLKHQVGTHFWPALVAGTFFVVNPFVYDRMLAGQILLTASYAALPWALASFGRIAERGTRGDVLRGVAWVVLIGLIDIHGGAMALFLAVIAALFSPQSGPRRLGFAALLVGGFILINLYWILPPLLAGEGARLGAGDFTGYAPRPRSASILPTIFMLHGFWRLEFASALAAHRVLFLAAFVPLVIIAFVGLSHATAYGPWRRASSALGISCLIAAVLAMGPSFPLTEPVTRFLFERMPGYGIFREPQKWVAVLSLGYAVFVGVGLNLTSSALARFRPWAPHLVAGALLLPLVATNVMLWGFGGRVQLSKFPEDWSRVDEVTAGKEGSMLGLPWNLYEPINFAGERTIANPMPHFFRSEVVISADPRLFVRQDTESADPRDAYVQTILNRGGELEELGHLLAPLGIRYVALAHMADWSSFKFLRRQDDLKLVFDGEDITLYENTAWAGDSYSMEEGDELQSLRAAVEEPTVREESTRRLHIIDPGREPAPSSGPSLIKALPGWDTIDQEASPITGTSRSCLDGWRLGDASPVCHLGAFAAFDDSGGDELWRPRVGIQILGLLMSLAAAAGLVVLLWRESTRKRSPQPEAVEREPTPVP